MDEIDLRMYVNGIRYCIADEDTRELKDSDMELGYSHQYQFEQMLSNRSEG